jgi:hypothetical protein
MVCSREESEEGTEEIMVALRKTLMQGLQDARFARLRGYYK